MNKAIISAASLIFISGTTLGREVVISPTASFHGTSVLAERHAAKLQVARIGGVRCTTKYITVTRGDGGSETHQSVNCEE